MLFEGLGRKPHELLRRQLSTGEVTDAMKVTGPLSERSRHWLCEHYLHEGKQMDTFDQILWGPCIGILFNVFESAVTNACISDAFNGTTSILSFVCET